MSQEENTNKNKNSELRQDIVTGDWVVIATGRSKRPEEFAGNKRAEIIGDSSKACLFCDPVASGQEKDVLIYEKADGDWSLRVFPNKYPAFSRPIGGAIRHQEDGPYFRMDSVGYHEIVVTKDHKKQIAQLDCLEVAEIIDAYQSRYIGLMNKKSVNYIDIFHNHGKEAGASIAHPHSQLMAIPVISPYVNLELNGSEEYYKSNKHCVYCAMIEWEEDDKKRIVFENEDFLVFCPFASRAAFETWVIPKKHTPYFERVSNSEKIALGEALQTAINKIWRALGDPAYNFYIHTAPCDGKDYPHFHWHIEILPRTSIWAGFELSTGVEISTIEPEVAADFLRNQ
ncbi:MAG: galactose-1-phosphate uridylyltransferase [Candidatus Moranbacteria bacterium RIFOXYA12_FULL_44_15]|nr:MAG: galactose-1-phosphate uridylyltransferase [Candidatus Moranbacteria bacterium RIFOXYA12_FULL_44_15]OGI34224.1 MAG: galactose-1-phosphate uridylyltransferase [Candidatus Moranbacteria bacterium RIFOXYA2_FULL_43_15]